MTELDQIWSKMLQDAGANAANSGRRDVAEYLRLKASNDAIRLAGVAWLFSTVIEIATQAAQDANGVTIERVEPHNFKYSTSNMVGSLVRVRQGVRCLTFEAGWARTPSDGIMRKGSLAVARVTHFGMPKYNVEIRFVHADPLPQWQDDEGRVINGDAINSHFDILFGG
ncbi:MAG: hypothetical protein AB7J13_07695 [Pyrinomonadaceae bacterium]